MMESRGIGFRLAFKETCCMTLDLVAVAFMIFWRMSCYGMNMSMFRKLMQWHPFFFIWCSHTLPSHQYAITCYGMNKSLSPHLGWNNYDVYSDTTCWWDYVRILLLIGYCDHKIWMCNIWLQIVKLHTNKYTCTIVWLHRLTKWSTSTGFQSLMF